MSGLCTLKKILAVRRVPLSRMMLTSANVDTSPMVIDVRNSAKTITVALVEQRIECTCIWRYEEVITFLLGLPQRRQVRSCIGLGFDTIEGRKAAFVQLQMPCTCNEKPHRCGQGLVLQYCSGLSLCLATTAIQLVIAQSNNVLVPRRPFS
jgi:hypothetical protein